MPTSQHLEILFRNCFAATYNTILVGGADEPLYRPAEKPGEFHRLYYREDYVRSALHEIAHWCIAGESRRQRPDFGYWYEPDGRTPEQQTRFLQVEVRPQALEKLFCEALRIPFRVSLDNLDGDPGINVELMRSFGRKVDQVADLLSAEMPPRARQWHDCLIATFQPVKDAETA